jgi:hypothetical protein
VRNQFDWWKKKKMSKYQQPKALWLLQPVSATSDCGQVWWTSCTVESQLTAVVWRMTFSTGVKSGKNFANNLKERVRGNDHYRCKANERFWIGWKRCDYLKKPNPSKVDCSEPIVTHPDCKPKYLYSRTQFE